MDLKKTFTQRPEQFSFVNHFGARFLKNRIRMMNQKTKYRRSWPVYVFLLAVTGLVTTMAAVQKQRRTVLVPAAKTVGEQSATTGAVTPKPARPAAKPSARLEPAVVKLVEQPVVASDSVRTVEEPKPAAAEKMSRYVVQKDNLVYWVITPKMSFNDLIELKQTIEKVTPFTFDFNKIKYDPFQLYLDAIEVKVHKQNGSSGSSSDDDENDEPIKSFGGYLAGSGSLGIGRSEGFSEMPAALQRLVKEDEKITAALRAENRMQYFILRNRLKLSGATTVTLGQWLRDNPGRRNEGLGVFVNAENRLQLYHPENLTVIINGREMASSEVATIDPKQLHTVIVTDVRDEAAGPGRKKRYIQLFESQPLEEFK